MKNKKTIKAGVVVQQEAAPSVRAESGDDDMNDNQQQEHTPSEVPTVERVKQYAEQGVAQAQLYLGSLYATGNGVQLDYEEAWKWFKKAAGQGHSDALNILGLLCAGGCGVPQDYMQARVYWELAAELSALRISGSA